MELERYNSSFFDFVEQNPYIEKMFYLDENDLSKKIDYYLNNDDEREEIAKKAHDYIIKNHTFESRVKLILENI